MATKKLTYTSQLTVVEEKPLSTDPYISSNTPSDKRDVYNGLDSAQALTDTTTPAVTASALFDKAMTSGAATIDLRALPGPGGVTIDGNGKKVIAYKFQNKSTHTITIVGGASNGYLLFGASGSIVLGAGCEILGYCAATAVTIDSTHKTLDISGTGADSLACGFVLG